LAENDTLEIGQQLKILPFKGVIHKVSAGDNLWTIAQDYGIDISDILEFNMIEDEGESLQIGQEVLLPGAKLKANSSSILDEKLKRKTRSSQIIGKGKLGMPARGKITSRFGSRWGRMHQGIDIAAPTGQNIYAAKGGKVVFSGWRGNYGKLVIIDHGDGLSTYYGHNSRNLVSKGDRVDKGEVIAKVGSTGRSTGPHVHFEVRINGQPVNPLKWTK
jgi:murein DD-endopeptidase MepM/ murein hydrolase activator NlpD